MRESLEKLYATYLASTGVSSDTRTVKAGNIFFALKGPNFNANQLAEQALEKGALIAVIDDEKYALGEKTFLVDDVLKSIQELAQHHRKSLTFPVLGITGTNGKTTTKELLKHSLSPKYKVSATAGNYNNHIGVPLTILSCPRDAEFLIVEMGTNQPGDIKLLCDIALPSFGLITNIGAGHLEKLGSVRGVFEEKRALFDSVNSLNDGVYFVNVGDPFLIELTEEVNNGVGYDANACPIGEISWGINEIESLSYSIQNEEEVIQGNTSLVGDYNRENISAAITVADYFDVPIGEILEAIAAYVPQNMRSQTKQTEKNLLLIDAYNANPTSVKAAIHSFQLSGSLEAKALILGDMLELGEKTLEFHEQILDIIKNWPRSQVVLIGPIYYKLAKDKWNVFKNTSDALSSGLITNWSDKKVLIKGSRGIGLEKLIDSL